MKKLHKTLLILLVGFLLCGFLSVPAFAAEGDTITEDEVREQVDAHGKEAVTGGIFVWFLCAIAFLKASQKIDSFMSSLGINVGHTGGSLLAEAMIAAKGINFMRGGGGHFSGGHSSGGGPGGGSGGGFSGGFMAGGLSGAVGKSLSHGAASSVTGQGGGGLKAGISRKMFDSSLAKGGDFANDVIGSVAKGDIKSMGTMTGETADAALASYMGYTQGVNSEDTIKPEACNQEIPSFDTLEGEGAAYVDPVSVPSDGGTIDTESSTIPSGGDPYESSEYPSQSSAYQDTVLGARTTAVGVEVPPIPQGASEYQVGSTTMPHVGPMSNNGGDNIPTFSHVELGGGRITGVETSVSAPEGIKFAMYSVEQYSEPQGHYSTVQSVDGSKWYKQYAQDTVERTPYMNAEGKVKYQEKIVQNLPKPPTRKERQ